jgi:guanylate kinase
LNEKVRSGNLIIVSGPSGAGKSVLASRVLQGMPHLRFSVSYTTRAPRGAEQNGVEYFFVNREEFQALIQGNDLLEFAEVHGNYYGTSRAFVDELLRQGEDVLLDIDIQGASIVRQKRPDAVGVFILPPSFQILRDRLMRRSLDAGFVIEQRLKIARREIRHYNDYDYLIINEEINSSTLELQSIILGARCRTAARRERAESVIATFGGE